MSKSANGVARKRANTAEQSGDTKTFARWRTEGCIKEVKLDDESVTLQIEPTEAFSVGVDGAKKILFVKEEETDAKDAKLVEAETSFVLGKSTDGECTKIPFPLLYQIKKDHARIRMVVENLESVSQIKSITFI